VKPIRYHHLNQGTLMTGVARLCLMVDTVASHEA
jgi:hypothetical protein